MLETRQVIIVGAGPSGLTLAHTLRRYGVDALLLERRPEPSNRARATGVSSRSMEIMRWLGLEFRVRSASLGIHLSVAIGNSVSAKDLEVSTSIAGPSLTSTSSPSACAFVPQHLLERELSSDIDVMRGAEVVSARQDNDQLLITYLDGDGVARNAACEVLVGADGAKSRVLQFAGVGKPRVGPAYDDQVTYEIDTDLRNHVAMETWHSLYVILRESGVSPISLWPVGEERWIAAHAAKHSLELSPRLIGELFGARDLVCHWRKLGRFSMNCYVADRFVKGRFAFVGDAAHAVAPRGGTGLNSAIQDGFSLGWRLGWCFSGRQSLLEALEEYESERRPLALRDASVASTPMGLMRTPQEELDIERGGRLKHVWVDRNNVTSSLDLLGPYLTTFAHDAAYDQVQRSDGGNRYLLDHLTARKLGLSRGQQARYTPDGRIFDARWV